MKGPRDIVAEITRKVDLPCAVTAQLPCTVVEGFHTVTVDMQKGLISYSEDEISVAVPLGRITVAGKGLSVTLMKQGMITLSGEIREIRFEREAEHV